MGTSIIPAFWPSQPHGVRVVVLGSELSSCLPSLLHSLSAPFLPTPPSLFSAAIHVCNTRTLKITSHSERGAILNYDALKML